MSEQKKKVESYKEHSRLEYIAKDPTPFGPFSEILKTGSLQRIADAVESAAAGINRTVDRLGYLEREVVRLREENRRLTASNNSLRGHITRLRRKYDL